MGERDQGMGLLGFCVAANIAEETAHGDGGLELQRGVRHFAPRAKVWVLPAQWGDGGAQVVVAGHHRGAGGRGYARMVVSRLHLTRFRVQGIYSPALMRALTAPVKGKQDRPVLWATREEADQAAALWNGWPISAQADDYSFFDQRVTDPPPGELLHRGQVYYLAHFSARRSLFSAATAGRAAPLAADPAGWQARPGSRRRRSRRRGC